ncbi:hypothetical protein [Streptomyces sp. XD-27]|uniref:hypothetical protein n=1 Tax=Streptomyces sp. XD-27 TaxID=3062779 RepID=UPI0026F41491|nr:hypothetical protein [Streptomyces sp. XD-27]WKX73942.1 hypothetical protein Q3Y56_32370 [Streptomyces sp. XD-27]
MSAVAWVLGGQLAQQQEAQQRVQYLVGAVAAVGGGVTAAGVHGAQRVRGEGLELPAHRRVRLAPQGSGGPGARQVGGGGGAGEDPDQLPARVDRQQPLQQVVHQRSGGFEEAPQPLVPRHLLAVAEQRLQYGGGGGGLAAGQLVDGPAEPFHAAVGLGRRHPAARLVEDLLGLPLHFEAVQVAQLPDAQAAGEPLRPEPFLGPVPAPRVRAVAGRPAPGVVLQRLGIAARGGQHQQRVGGVGPAPHLQQELQEVAAQRAVDVVEQQQAAGGAAAAAAAAPVGPAQVVQERLEQHGLGPFALLFLLGPVALVEGEQEGVGREFGGGAPDAGQPPAGAQPGPAALPLGQQQEGGVDQARGAEGGRGVGQPAQYLGAAAVRAAQRVGHVPDGGVPAAAHLGGHGDRQQAEGGEGEPGEVLLAGVEFEDRGGQRVDRLAALLPERGQVEPCDGGAPGPLGQPPQQGGLAAAARAEQQRDVQPGGGRRTAGGGEPSPGGVRPDQLVLDIGLHGLVPLRLPRPLTTHRSPLRPPPSPP